MCIKGSYFLRDGAGGWVKLLPEGAGGWVKLFSGMGWVKLFPGRG
jgi:hypothetical protein